uniref:RING-type E3 ubiquitin transferase n=1 Tax=Nothobranchius rachovii TaxID=451742 RepID=A0A1A8RPJ3_9TELE
MSASDWEGFGYQKYKREKAITTYRVSEEVLDKWVSIPVQVKRDAAQQMKVCVFWLPTLLQPEDSEAYDWAMDVGLVSSRDNETLTLDHLAKIQVVERILFYLEIGTLERECARHVFSISNMLNLQFCPETLEATVRFLEKAGDCHIRSNLRTLGDFLHCFTTLGWIFSEYAKFIRELSKNVERTMEILLSKPEDYIIEKSEAMKKKGNDKFQKQQFEEAVKYYSKAIKYCPENHILYGNRALCFIKCKQYLKAAADGKLAVLIKPLWAKGHYRYCEALFYLGQTQLAFEANSTAKSLCRDNPDELRDLDQQYQKFMSELTFTELPKSNQSFKDGLVTRTQTSKTGGKSNPGKSSPAKVTKMDRRNRPNETASRLENTPVSSKPSKSEKVQFSTSEEGRKKKQKNEDRPRENQSHVVKSKACVSDMRKELQFLMQDAHMALDDLRSRNAAQAFGQALDLVESATPKELGLSTLDVLLLLFGRTLALTEIGQPEELTEAQKLLEKMKSYEERTFQCLCFYALGKVFLRENRFAVALQQFSDSLQMVKNQISPGKLTWPLTKEVVKETQPDYFRDLLERCIELCRFPPAPDAVCRLEICLCPLKTEIYLTDPDFKGYVQMCCCQSCRVEFHINCWKSLKTTKFSDKNEKDILHEKCLTPDCVGQISSIKIYCPTGLVKCKFESTISKPAVLKRPKGNQKCTSLKKLRSKEEHKVKRKQYKQLSEEKKTSPDEILQQKEESGSQSQQKTWLLYRDRVLLLISQNVDLLREERGLQISVLTGSLKPWLELDLLRGNQIARRLLNHNQQESVKDLGQVVELLLERKNRVWARVFVQELSSCVDIDPKLSSWACQLNAEGLNSARSFIDRHSEHLEQLDLTLLLEFGPLKEMILEKLSIRPEFFSSNGLTVTEYLKQAPPHDMRLFIWTLEEHKDHYVSCHTILDEYFYTMDGHCSVLKKSDENNSPTKAKSRGRKKKQKEKGVFVLSGVRALKPREEWDQDLFEDDSLSFLHPADPFSVPSHLREEVADFEDQYNTRTKTYKSFLDNNPDPTRESLYDYFAQILEEHGPLNVEDRLLVGELENFPAVAKQKIEEAGGVEAFLVESLRFIKMGRRVGLAKHAVRMQQSECATSLDNLDDIDDVCCISSPPDFYTACDFTSYLGRYPPAYTDSPPILPNPYPYSSQLQESSPRCHWSEGDLEQPYEFLPVVDPDLDAPDADFSVLETDLTPEKAVFIPADENLFRQHAAVQTHQVTKRSVAVNTELYSRFENRQGDINKKEKSIRMLERQIKKMKNQIKVSPSKDEAAILEEEIKTISSNIQVTHKELAMFQEKLEEEVKKYQKEKKANQEELKALKMAIEQLGEEQTSLSQTIRDNNSIYEEKLNDFLELSNQSAGEKMSLEDEIKRCRSLLGSASRRVQTAQLSMVNSSCDQALSAPSKELADSKALLVKLDEVCHRAPNEHLEMTRKNCRAKIEELEKNISTAERRFQEQLDQLKNSRGDCENGDPEPAAAPLCAAAKDFVPQPSAQASNSMPPPAAEAPAVNEHKAVKQKPGPLFDRVMESLTAMFPDYSRPDLMKYVAEFRLARSGSLYAVTLQDCVSGVTQRILDHQEKLKRARANVVGRSSPARSATPLPLTQAPVWQPLKTQRVRNPDALNMEDPCIICHEDMSPDNTCVLECRHSFHKECIRSWLKEQNTCPTCRNHALLPEDFPALSGRKRHAP